MDSTVRCVPLYNGYAMPIIGLGMWLTDNEELVRVAVKAAVDSGYRHIDTAFAYKNETFLGKVLQEIFCEGKIK
ncbi:Aldose reductase, partial [Stegodyphus mimosarum]